MNEPSSQTKLSIDHTVEITVDNMAVCNNAAASLALGGSVKQKRGKRAGLLTKLKGANASRPAIPSLFLSNVRALDN